MKKILPIFLVIFSSLLFSQSFYSTSTKSNDVDKLLVWLQYNALQEGIAIEYGSAIFRNNILEINDLKISEYAGRNVPTARSLGDLISGNSGNLGTGAITAKKIKINFKSLVDLSNFSKSRNKTLLANMYKSQAFFEIQELRFPSEVFLEEIGDELNFTQLSIANRAANYLNNLSVKVEVKAKGRFRADAIFTADLNDELSLLYSIDSSIDADNLGYQYFSVLEKIVAPLDQISSKMQSFIAITTIECPALYEKNNIDAWFAYSDNEYCRSADRFLSELDLESEIDALDEDILNNEMFLMSNPLGSKMYGFQVNLNWSNRALRDASILSGGVIDTALLTIKSIFDTRLNKQEFDQLLYQFSGPEYGEIISSVLQGDEIYREYSKYQPKIKSFANNPQGIGFTIKSRSGIDEEYLFYAAENPLLLVSLLDDIELELLLNKRN